MSAGPLRAPGPLLPTAPNGVARRCVAARQACPARPRLGLFFRRAHGYAPRGERLHTLQTRPAASGSERERDGGNRTRHRFLELRSDVAAQSSTSTTSSTAQELMQSAKSQILHQLHAAGAATHAAAVSSSNGIVSGYASSQGSLSASFSSGDGMSSMDEYSTNQLDFSDLANEDGLSEGGREGGAGSYSKANYEVLRLDATAKARRFFVRRRDVLREHRLQPRDLRRIDPSIDFTKTSPSITIKEDVLLLNLGGVRAIVTAEKALLFEPNSATSRKFLEVVLPRLQTHGSARALAAARGDPAAYVNSSHADYMARFYHQGKLDSSARTPPFELEVLEGALTVAVGRLDAEMGAVTGRVSALLTKLPSDITPVNLEELRRVKQALVELEDKADTLREMLEELMDDEDELRELNLSSRPRREDRRRQRERKRLEREVERARGIKEELEERALDDGQPITPALPPNAAAAAAAAAAAYAAAAAQQAQAQAAAAAAAQQAQQGGSGPGAPGVSGAPDGPGGGGVPYGVNGSTAPYTYYGAGGAPLPPRLNGVVYGGGGAAAAGAGYVLPPGYPQHAQQQAGQPPHSQPPPPPQQQQQQQHPTNGLGTSTPGLAAASLPQQPLPSALQPPPPPPPPLPPPQAVRVGYVSSQSVIVNGSTVGGLVDAGYSSGYVQIGPYGSAAAPELPGSRSERLRELRSKYDRERLRELRARFGWVREGREDGGGSAASASGRAGGAGSSNGAAEGGSEAGKGRGSGEEREGRERRKELIEDADFISRLGDSEEDLQEAQDALEEMVEEEEEEVELEEVEDLLEFYLQRASALQSEAERMLAGARDLEESIGVSLSARRYEVNRLELMLSIGSFAAAVGAVLAGIFGMNMRSNLEHSAASFWGVTAGIVLGCGWIFFAMLRYTRSKRIL